MNTNKKTPEWHEAITQLEPYVFQIHTPDGSGTGCLISRSKTTPLCIITTAAHVINHAHYWEEPIRLVHYKSGASLLLRPAQRALNIDEATDTASISFEHGDLKLPEEPLPLMQKDFHIKPGVQLGWLGFPAVAIKTVRSFSGDGSAYIENESSYLIDGVAINGVSGGPAFRCIPGTAQLIGIVSAYIPNRATGTALPGVALIRDVNRFHDEADRLKTLDEAMAKQTPPAEPPPPSSATEGPQSAPPTQTRA